MADLQPTFTLTIDAYRATSAEPGGGPSRLVVERDMDVACDALRVWLTDRSGIELDADVSLDLGHDGTEDTVFKGKVVGLRPAVDGVELWALGGLRELLALRVAAAYENQTAGAIARDLAGRAGLSTGTIEDGPSLPRYVADSRRDAYAHLRALADRLGFELYADIDGQLMFHAPGGLGGEAYAYGEHLLDVGADRRPPVLAGVAVSGESPMSTEGDSTVAWLTTDPADYRGTAGSGDLLVVDAVARTKDLADRFATGIMSVGERTAHVVLATVLGRPGLDLGATVDVSGHADSVAAGSGYVRALRHRFDDARGFVTDVRVAVDA